MNVSKNSFSQQMLSICMFNFIIYIDDFLCRKSEVQKMKMKICRNFATIFRDWKNSEYLHRIVCQMKFPKPNYSLPCMQLTAPTSKRTQSSTSQAMRCRLLKTRRRNPRSTIAQNQNIDKQTEALRNCDEKHKIYARRVSPLRSGTGPRGLIQEKTKR